MSRLDLRRLVTFLRIGERAIDALGLVAFAALFFSYVSPEVLNARPATGGDTGSHFWPLVTLVKHALPNLTIRVWNPGNLGGEPHLVNYFPFPYFVMAALSLAVPLGTAFNLGTISPLFFLPFSAYASVRLLGYRFPAPLLAASTSLLFLYNESFSMWGGNTLSTLAGQFTHAWALNLILLGIGCLAWEHRRGLPPCVSSCVFAAVATSHAYVLLGIPLSALAFVFFHHEGSFKSRSIITAECGAISVLLSVWFLVPMVENAPWTTAFFIYWSRENLLAETFPRLFYPAVAAIGLCLIFLAFRPGNKRTKRRAFSGLMMWLVPCIGYTGYYFVFPVLGLVDVRAFPQIQLFVCILAGLLVGICLARDRLFAFFVAPVVVGACIFWADLQVSIFPRWVPWNYSGWETKAPYAELTKLYDALRGDFSMPRVVYEHNEINNSTGTIRVFEMLPYFTGRATLESCYLQASILAPMAFLLQAEVSKTPSCPFAQYECKPFDLEAARARLELMGVSDLVLVTEPLIEMGRRSSYLNEVGRFGWWSLFRTIQPATLVEVFHEKPLLISDDYWKNRYTRLPIYRPDDIRPPNPERLPVDLSNWKDAFYYWFYNYIGTEPMMIADRNLDRGMMEALRSDEYDPVWESTEECRPTLEVTFDRIKLKTPCRGRAHVLKFAYHSAWRSDSGDPLYLVSPGFIAIVPSRDEVTLTFGPVRRWQAAGAISLITLALVVVTVLRRHLLLALRWLRSSR